MYIYNSKSHEIMCVEIIPKGIWFGVQDIDPAIISGSTQQNLVDFARKTK